jgi:tetratricopeptide (TPR) repeat protein
MIEELIASLAPRGPSARLVQSYLRQGDVATLLKRFSAAERALSTALRMSRALGEAALERTALRSIGLLRWHEGHHAHALQIAESALAIARDSGDDLAVAGDLANIGIILKSMGEHARALASLEEALAMPALRQEPSKLLYALHNLGNVHRALGDLDRALECLQRANEIARANLLPIPRSFHLTAIAHVYLQQGRVDLALQTYRDAVALSQRARHADGLAQSQRALGEVLFALGKDTEALPCLREAARLFAQLEDREAEGEMSGRIAVILERASWLAEAAHHNTLGIREWQAGRYAAALQHYEAGLRLVRAQGHRAHEGLMLNSIGVTLHRLSRHDEARAVLDESIALNREIGEGLLEAHALAVLGDVWRACGRPDLAASCFEQSLALRVTLVDLDGERAMRARLAETRAAAAGTAGIHQFRQD